MSHLTKMFNQTYLKWLQNLSATFCLTEDDHPRLRREVSIVKQVFERDPSTKVIHKEFERTVTDVHIRRIQNEDHAVFSEIQEGVIHRCGISAIHAELKREHEEDLETFWKSIQAICRHSALMRACGDKLSGIESLTQDLMQKQQEKSERGEANNPAEFQMDIVRELMNGDTHQKMLELLRDPTFMKGIQKHIGTIMKQGKADTGAEALDSVIADIDVNETDLDEMADELKKAMDDPQNAKDFAQMMKDIHAGKAPPVPEGMPPEFANMLTQFTTNAAKGGNAASPEALTTMLASMMGGAGGVPALLGKDSN